MKKVLTFLASKKLDNMAWYCLGVGIYGPRAWTWVAVSTVGVSLLAAVILHRLEKKS